MKELHFQKNVPFKLFADCILTKGANRTLIADISRTKHYFIPNELELILTQFNGKSIESILKKYSKKDHVIILEYFEFLFENELIFFTHTPNLFPEINLNKFEVPSIIYQAIIDVDEASNHNYLGIINSLDTLNCKYLDVRVFNIADSSDLIRLFNIIEKSGIIGVNLYLKYCDFMTSSYILNFFKSYLRINNLFVFGANKNKTILKSINNPFNIVYVKELISNCTNCGVISPAYFAINIEAISEAKTYNSCLNKKVSIDSKGEIKNCPSMSTSFGNIETTKIEDVVIKSNFKDIWKINKDKIDVCKDCEYRYICTDCRAYIENPTDLFSKPLKCGYNPYTSTWTNWKSKIKTL